MRSIGQRSWGLVVLLLLTTAAWGETYESWPTTDFEVVLAVPYNGKMEQLDSDSALGDALFQADADVQKSVHAIEIALSEAAIWFRDMGFPPPEIQPIVKTENGPAYQVYLCSESSLQSLVGPQGYHPCSLIGEYMLPGCESAGHRNRFMYINHEKTLDEQGDLTELGYFTVAHELFHAITASTGMVRSDPNCKMGDWIAEGLADAISTDFATRTWKGYYEPHPPNINKIWGWRPYFYVLHQKSRSQGGGQVLPGYEDQGRQDLSYLTSSFWRYLADSHPRGWRMLVHDKGKNKSGLLDGSLPSGPGMQSEVEWLDKGLKAHFGRGLREMYAFFVVRFPYHIPDYQGMKGKPMQEKFERWVEMLFGTCDVVDLGSASSQVVSFQFEAISSHCIWVVPFGEPGLAPISFTATSTDLKLLQDMTIGRSGTTLASRASPAGSSLSGPGVHYATWRDFPQDGSTKNLYVISNVSQKPGETEFRDEVTFVVMRGGHDVSSWENSPMAASMAPPPLKPSHTKEFPKLSKQLADTKKMVEQQANLDKKSVNPNVSSGNAMTRNPDRRECAESFKYQPCGPSTSVGLGLRPGTAASFTGISGEGGLAAQAMSGLQAMASTMAVDDGAQIPEYLRAKNAIDGNEINIVMPMLEYGFTGEVNRAAIQVTMKDEKNLHAVGPPDGEGRQLLTGRVKIDEYSPHVLRGSFTAPLAEIVESVNGTGRYVRRETVTGTFTIVAPWQSDERIAIVHDDQQQMVDDLANTLGVSADASYEVIQVGDRQRVVPKQGSATSGSGLSSGECSCECDMRGKVDDLCELFCEEEFAACDAP